MTGKDCATFFSVYNVLILLIVEWSHGKSELLKLFQSITYSIWRFTFLNECYQWCWTFREKVIIACLDNITEQQA